MTTHENSSVAILLCTYNGAQFIEQQLSSYLVQKNNNWSLWVSDDGSTDDTREIINFFSENSQHNVHILEGPRQGVCNNFLALINNDDIKEKYYAFSDQDDIWSSDKLLTATNWLDVIDPEVPALYCSRTELIDAKDQTLGLSPLYTKPPSFSNALLQNIASGNTMVFNKKARDLLKNASATSMVIHDWALYLTVTGCGGKVYFDQQPSVLYRQHDNNLIGNGMGCIRRISNYFHAYKGRKVNWNSSNIAMMKTIVEMMTTENREVLSNFSAIRDSSLFKRFYFLNKSGVYHQQLVGTLTTLSYTLFNRM